MSDYNYIVEESTLYIILPLSFKTTNYIIEMTDRGQRYYSYSVSRVSTNKIQVFNINIDGPSKEYNYEVHTGFVLTLGF